MDTQALQIMVFAQENQLIPPITALQAASEMKPAFYAGVDMDGVFFVIYAAYPIVGKEDKFLFFSVEGEETHKKQAKRFFIGEKEEIEANTFGTDAIVKIVPPEEFLELVQEFEGIGGVFDFTCGFEEHLSTQFTEKNYLPYTTVPCPDGLYKAIGKLFHRGSRFSAVWNGTTFFIHEGSEHVCSVNSYVLQVYNIPSTLDFLTLFDEWKNQNGSGGEQK